MKICILTVLNLTVWLMASMITRIFTHTQVSVFCSNQHECLNNVSVSMMSLIPSSAWVWPCPNTLHFHSDANSPYNSSYIPASKSRLVLERVVGSPPKDNSMKVCRRAINSYSKASMQWYLI